MKTWSARYPKELAEVNPRLCPLPIGNDWTAASCIVRGDCGCDEEKKFHDDQRDDKADLDAGGGDESNSVN